MGRSLLCMFVLAAGPDSVNSHIQHSLPIHQRELTAHERCTEAMIPRNSLHATALTTAFHEHPIRGNDTT